MRIHASMDSEVEAELLVLKKLNSIMAKVQHIASMSVSSLTVPHRR